MLNKFLKLLRGADVQKSKKPSRSCSFRPELESFEERITPATSIIYANGLLTCHHPLWGSLHANLGSAQDQAGSYVITRGLAWERSLGSVTLHLESFGQQNSKPARAIGLRHDVLPQLQIDASLGYQAGQTLTTMGLKWMF